MEELAENSAHQTMFYQLYVNKDRSQTVKKLTQAVKLGYKGVCITIDAPVRSSVLEGELRFRGS